MNVPWVCKYPLHACTKGEVGCTYQAWTSVVFLPLAGIAKPSVSVKDRRISRFSCVYTLNYYYMPTPEGVRREINSQKMKISWNGKRAIVIYDDGTKYNGEYNRVTGRDGIGALTDIDGSILQRGVWSNNELIREMSDEEYNRIRTNW